MSDPRDLNNLKHLPLRRPVILTPSRLSSAKTSQATSAMIMNPDV